MSPILIVTPLASARRAFREMTLVTPLELDRRVSGVLADEVGPAALAGAIQTLYLDPGLREGLGRWARIWAAQHNTSVSKMLSDLLTQKMRAEDEYERAMRSWLARKPHRLADGHG